MASYRATANELAGTFIGPDTLFLIAAGAECFALDVIAAAVDGDGVEIEGHVLRVRAGGDQAHLGAGALGDGDTAIRVEHLVGEQRAAPVLRVRT